VPRMLSAVDVDVVVDHHLFGLCDGASVEPSPPAPRRIGHRWLSAGTAQLYLESAEDIIKARVHFESWDGPPPFDESAWPDHEVVSLSLPSGVLSVDQITAGAKPDVFVVGPAGRYAARLAWREVALDLAGIGEPEAFALAQFWPATAG
jgi:hypothetical protein